MNETILDESDSEALFRRVSALERRENDLTTRVEALEKHCYIPTCPDCERILHGTPPLDCCCHDKETPNEQAD